MTEVSSFGDFLVGKGIITQPQLKNAVAMQDKGRLLGKLALEDGCVTNQGLVKISDFPSNELKPDGLTKMADAALNSAKQMGRNQVAAHSR